MEKKIIITIGRQYGSVAAMSVRSWLNNWVLRFTIKN